MLAEMSELNGCVRVLVGNDGAGELVVDSSRAGPQTTTELQIDAALIQLPIVRAVARTLAHRRGFRLHELVDIAHAVDEVGVMLIDAAAIGSPLRCSFVVSGAAFLLTSTVTSRRGLLGTPVRGGGCWRD